MLQKIQIILLIFLVVALTAILGVLWHKQETALLDDQNLVVPEGLTEYELGQYYFNQGDSPDGAYDLQKAQDYFRKAVAASTTANDMAWHQLGRTQFIMGQFDYALYSFAKQRQYFGDTIPNVHYMIALTHGFRAKKEGDEADWKKAEEHFILYSEFDPDSPWARVDLAWVYFAQGKFEQMIEPLEIGLQKHPTNPWLLNMYGLALLNTNQKEEAHKQFLLAQTEVGAMGAADWGVSYPGNNPADWPQGLQEFKDAVDQNVTLTAS